MHESDGEGIIYTGAAVRANRRLNLVSILLPALGTLLAVVLASVEGWAPSANTWTLFAAFFVLQLWGISVGLHRYFTHHAFRTGRVIHTFLAVAGSFAFQGPIDRWVADHRRHHRFTDRPLDPHSPYWVEEREAGSRAQGLLHAHMGWMFTCPVSDPKRYAPDILRDPITRWCSAHYWWLCAASVLLPASLGALAGGPREALLGGLWAGFARVALLQQITWSVNSIGHSFGRKLPGGRDESRDIPLLALLLFGDGLHSYHHRYPAAAVNHPSALDLNGMLLGGLERLGWVWDLRRFPEGPPTESVSAG